MRKFKLLLTILAISVTIQLSGQTKYDLELYSFGGREYNIFKGPDKLLDPLGQYYNTNDIIISDYFVESGIDTKYEFEKKKKYIFELGGDFKYRKNFNNPDLDQKHVNFNAVFEKYISKKINIGLGYEFSWKDKIGVSVTGDELTRSFKYYSNQGLLYLNYNPNKKLEFAFESYYELKNYYDDTTDMSLNHNNFDFLLESKYSINKKNEIIFIISYTDRSYIDYLALDVTGSSSTNEIRHFNYLSFDLHYNWEPYDGFFIGPGVEYRKRNDLFEKYYNYSQLDPSLSLKYRNKKWYVYLKTAYRTVNYETKYAYTEIPNTDHLQYNYFDLGFKVKYKALKKLEIYANYNLNNRYSNTTLENKRTRRNYGNNEVMLGLIYTISDYNSKYDKKK
ncbi:MAG: hypothetical protein PF485_14190 [Bacteroidales bacterium]|jgi:hypothetical protein|nr:hypothetical protein [Bacteroidales bacterium]